MPIDTTTTYEQLLERVIADGIEEVSQCYAEHPHKRRGAIAGFEACRQKSPAALIELYKSSASCADRIRRQLTPSNNTANEVSNYAYWRYYELQVEWVCNVISVGLVTAGRFPLFGHLPTARGVTKYAALVGVAKPDTAAAKTLA